MMIEQGLKVTKIHRVLQFEQKDWLKEYINFNTQKRKEAKSDFEKNFFKLINNAVYGKQMENLQNRMKIELVTSEKRLLKLVNKPTFSITHARVIILKNLVTVPIHKEQLKLNNIIYVGKVVLDLSKVLMANFHYNYIKKKYSNCAKLLFTDTNSLCYHIKTNNYFEDIKDNLDLFDTSEYSKNHPLYNENNKKVLGKFKDESSADLKNVESVGYMFIEFVELALKMCSLKKVPILYKSYSSCHPAADSSNLVNNFSNAREINIRDDKGQSLLINNFCNAHEINIRDDKEQSPLPLEKKVAKSVKKYVIKDQLHHEIYKQTLIDNSMLRVNMQMIRSENHQIYSITVNKISLSANDTKRAILPNDIDTLAYGHKDLAQYKSYNIKGCCTPPNTL